MPVESEFWTENRLGSSVCILVDDYGDSLVASAEAGCIAEARMKSALQAKFPNVIFTMRTDRKFGYVYAHGKRAREVSR